jgi:hypothetical protein
MVDRVNQDAWKIRKLMRETEALSDEMLIALSALKGEMLKARQNPEVEVHTGQQALLHLTEAEQLVTRASSQLFRTHSALSKVALTTAGVDENIATVEDGSRQTAQTQFQPAIALWDDQLP